jgi:hypothetical protein
MVEFQPLAQGWRAFRIRCEGAQTSCRGNNVQRIFFELRCASGSSHIVLTTHALHLARLHNRFGSPTFLRLFVDFFAGTFDGTQI